MVETAARLTPQPRRPSGHGPSPLEPAALDKMSHDPQRFSSLTLERAQVRSAPRNFTRPFNVSHLKPSTSRQVHCLTQTRQNGERERRDRRSVRIYLSISVLSCVKGGLFFARFCGICCCLVLFLRLLDPLILSEFHGFFAGDILVK